MRDFGMMSRVVTGSTRTGRGLDRLLVWLRASPVPYLSSLMVTLMLGAWANYLSGLIWPEGFAIKGQSLGIIVPIAGFPVTCVLWLVHRGRRARNPWVVVFMAGLGVSWAVHMLIMRTHGDQYTHLAWLFVPLLIMITMKAPTTRQAWNVVLVFAWMAVVVLVGTRLLEITGLIPIHPVDPWLIEYESQRYWLPFSGHLGLEGRWWGPFGYNSKTGFISTLLIVIGAARLNRSGFVFITVGALGVLLTGGRGSYLSLAAGILVLLVFAARGPLARIPVALRAWMAAGATAVLGLGFYLSPLSTSGRIGDGGIWDVFLNLWRTSPWLGVGQVGILANPDTGRWTEGHNILVQHLTRFGVLGVAAHFAVILLGLAIMAVAAYRGLAWPLAVNASYYAASLTDVFQDGWIQHSFYSLLLILTVLAAGFWLLPESSEQRRMNRLAAAEPPR